MKASKSQKIKYNSYELRVNDLLSKKNYFEDCEIIGWKIIKGKKGLQLYHLYRRYYNSKKDIMVNKECFYHALRITEEEEIKKELENFKHELMQIAIENRSFDSYHRFIRFLNNKKRGWY